MILLNHQSGVWLGYSLFERKVSFDFLWEDLTAPSSAVWGHSIFLYPQCFSVFMIFKCILLHFSPLSSCLSFLSNTYCHCSLMINPVFSWSVFLQPGNTDPLQKQLFLVQHWLWIAKNQCYPMIALAPNTCVTASCHKKLFQILLSYSSVNVRSQDQRAFFRYSQVHG